MPKNLNPDLSVIIVAHNVKALLRNCLSSLFMKNQGRVKFEVIVVDSGSLDNPSSLKKQFPATIFLNPEGNVGFSRGNNLGVNHSRGNYLFFLNPDTIIAKNSLEKLVNFAQATPGLGAVAPRLLNTDNSLQPSCFRLPTIKNAIAEFWLGKKGSFLKYAPNSTTPVKVDSAVGAAVLLPRKVFELIKGWDERYFMYYEDLELGRQIKKLGLDFWYLPEISITHIHGASSSQTPDLSMARLKKSSLVYHGLLNHLLITSIIWLSQKARSFQ